MGIHPLARWLAVASVSATLTASSPVNPAEPHEDYQPPQRLGVVVYTYRDDLERAVASLSRWPSSNCSPLTQQNADLVLYYGEGEEDSAAVGAAADIISQTAGRCFATTRIVYADLAAVDDVYPKGPSVMFYKMFLDQDVRSSLSEYDALSILEWDVLVASDRSFEQLYHAAFRTSEEFWVKGSNLEGTSFHSSAEMTDMWHVLGHINGNAIYNNNDPAFVEYVDYTRSRWQYDHPYDVALWLTISDFPYSWPLYQRYSNKFVVTNLISYVGNAHVDQGTVSDAVAGDTLFIHGRNIDSASKAATDTLSAKAPASTTPKSYSTDRRKRNRRQRKQRRLSRSLAGEGEQSPRSACTKACFGEAGSDSVPAGMSTVCDSTCAGEDARYGGFLCGAGDPQAFGHLCRLCYVDINEARKAELALSGEASVGEPQRRVIMCDTMMPPAPEAEEVELKEAGNAATDCSDKCFSKKNTVCDPSCGTGMHGDYNCGWKNRGSQCRFCFDDLDAALMADDVATGHGGRVIMCSTMAPPTRDEASIATNSRERRTRNLQKWRDNQKWKDLDEPKWVEQEKWRGTDSNDDDAVPKWRATEKWKNASDDDASTDDDASADDDDVTADDDGDDDGSISDCASGCEYTSQDGTRGRVCDATCGDSSVVGTLGCSAKSGQYGSNCRACYNDQDKALKNDSPDGRAIMCETVEPVDVYARRLSATADVESVSRVARMLQREAFAPKRPTTTFVDTPSTEADQAADFFTEAAGLPFVGDVTRSNLCAFIPGRVDEAEMWEVTTKSILEFVPGMRVAIAAESEGFSEYQRLMGGLPGVTVSRAEDVSTASLFADQYCGLGTSLILYVKPGSVLSRSFTAKDTHSVQGDLLVVYGGAQGSYHDTQLSRRTSMLLGLEAPSFTHGTDLVLPASVNADLREALGFGLEDGVSQRNRAAGVLGLQDLLEFDQVSAIPQMLAALAFSRDTPGVWFLDPQDWVSHHLFKEASIWEIPLVKPRYTCNIAPKFLEAPAAHQVAGVLQDNLEFFARGGKCDNGVIDFAPEE